MQETHHNHSVSTEKEGSRSHRVHEERKRTKPKHLNLLPALPISPTPSIATPVLSLPQKEVSWDELNEELNALRPSPALAAIVTIDRVVDITNVGIKGPHNTMADFLRATIGNACGLQFK